MPAHRTTTDPTEDPKSTCEHCGAKFVRREHLNRHLRTHTKEKPFRCQTCQKRFTRGDILRRHEVSHSIDESAKSSRSGLPFRACKSCAAGRVRCSGDVQCYSCEKKGIDCIYPTQQNTGSKMTQPMISPSEQAQESAEENMGDLPRSSLPSASYQPYESNSGPQRADLPDSNSIDNRFISQGGESRTVLNASMVTPASEWSPDWGRMQQHPDLDQFLINNDAAIYGIEPQNPANSINWVSPSSDIWNDWDYRFTSLAHPAFAQSFAPVLDGHGGGNVSFETAEDSSHWSQSLQMAASTPRPATIANSPTVESTTHSSRSERSPRAPVMNLGCEEGLTPSPRPYIDSIGARGTLQRVRRKRTNSILDIENSQRKRYRPDHASTVAEAETPRIIPWITQNFYDEMFRNVQLVAGQYTGPINLSTFPSLSMMNKLCQLYFNHFHPSFPFLRKSPFALEDGMWLLVIAVAAVGAQYALAPAVAPLKKLLAEILQGGVGALVHTPKNAGRNFATLPSTHESQGEIVIVVQARILNVLLLVHSGNAATMEKGLSEFNSLLVTNRRMHLLRPAHLEEQQTGRIQSESRVRTGYMIWMLDFIFSFEFSIRCQLELANAQANLPCSFPEWDNVEENERTSLPQICTLVEALEILYTEKRLIGDLNEFSRILIIQGICRMTMEARTFARNRMSTWIPSARRQLDVQFSDLELWPPSSSMLSKWRNCACDCLDILHWSANSKIAQSAGFEHPTVIYLHLARLIILTPFDSIQELVHAYASVAQGTPNTSRTNPTMNSATFQVLQWAICDQYKARLSLVHAAAIFWHIRRYRSDSFIEPFATYLSTLVIWSYSRMTQMSNNQQTKQTQEEHEDPGQQPDSTTDDDSEPDPSFINLDRPCDDESVQTFVRRGSKVTANMVRIGDICGKSAPSRILQEGSRLLGGGKDESTSNMAPSSTWSITQSYILMLQRLDRIMNIV